MIFATGDTHGNFLRFSTEHFPEQRHMGRNDYVIICGDFGGIWNDSRNDRYWLDWLDNKPFTTLWVDGNHENFDALNRLPVEEWHSGKVQRIRPNIIHLIHAYSFDDHTVVDRIVPIEITKQENYTLHNEKLLAESRRLLAEIQEMTDRMQATPNEEVNRQAVLQQQPILSVKAQLELPDAVHAIAESFKGTETVKLAL